MQYPIYDRSGVEDTDDTLPASRVRVRDERPPAAEQLDNEIYVCHAGTCVARGAEAVLTEIEELVSEVGGACAVKPTGCLGYCNEAPNAVVVERAVRRLDPNNVHVRLRSLEASAKVVKRATGRSPALDDAGTRGRLARLRAARARQHAIAACKWNVALNGLAEEAATQPAQHAELMSLLRQAGFPEGVGVDATMPETVENYSPWTLESVTPVTKHSAIYSYSSKNRKRGTPHPRGSGKLPSPVTWHTTLLAEVGANGEGPLPWIERDYTPISTAKEWEQGRCDLLVKIYANGAATSWLHAAAPERVRLSKPETTLHVPGLMPDGAGGRVFRPKSVLLLLAGTGVVALPQLLAHREPATKLGISTSRQNQLHVPIDLVLSCRADDVLLLPQIAQWTREGGEQKGVRSCTLLLTPAGASDAAPPFPDVQGGDAAEAASLLQGVANARVLHSRLSAELVAEAFARMPPPCRVVVSGPGEFNSAARGFLAELVDVEEQVTILTA